MKILHAVPGWPPEEVGGRERYVQRLAQAQAAAGHRIVVAAGSRLDRYDGRFHPVDDEGDGVEVHRISRRGAYASRWDHGASPFVATAFGALLEATEPDVVHLHGWSRLSRTLVRRAARLGLPTVVSLHDLAPTCPRLDRQRAEDPFCDRAPSVESCLGCVPREEWMEDEVVGAQIERYYADLGEELSWAAAWLVPSQAHARVLSRFAGLPRKRFDVVSQASSIEWTAPERDEPWTPGCGRALRIAHWGASDLAGGLAVLLRALRELGRPDELELVLWERRGSDVGGSGDAEPNEAVAGASRVERRRFRHESLRDLDADLAVLPTLAHEAHSHRLDEALALGLPALVSDRGAAAERLEGGGGVFPAGDFEALAAWLGRVLDEDGLLAGWRAALPEPTSMDEHLGALGERYEAALTGAKALKKTQPDDAHDREQWERIALALEEQGRHCIGLQRAAEREVTSLRRDVASSFAQVHAERAAVSAARGELAEALEELGAAHREAESLREQLRARGQEAHGLEVRLAESNAERNTLVNALEARLVELDRQLGEARGALDEKEARVRELEIRVAEQGAERNTVVNALEARLAELHGSVAEAARAREAAEAEVARMGARITGVETELEAFDAQLEVRTEIHDLTERERSALERRVHTLLDRLSATREERDELAVKNVELSAARSRDAARIARLSRENLFGFPLTLPARGLLWLWDRITPAPVELSGSEPEPDSDPSRPDDPPPS